MTPDHESAEERLTVRVSDAARILSVSPSTIRRLISAGVLRTVKLPESMSTRMIRVSDLKTFVDGESSQ